MQMLWVFFGAVAVCAGGVAVGVSHWRDLGVRSLGAVSTRWIVEHRSHLPR